ncbi:flagellar biosynthesis protein FlgJ [Burkholderia semiarida]|uniref:Flagellar biosynthesis protein FlgJ n=1 Tax=Burkholderia semiarida TaxID=2843303 RepID=A0ABW7LCT5_9BURK
MTDFNSASLASAAVRPGGPAGRPATAADPEYRAKVEQTAVRFEGMFIAQLLGEMRKAAEHLKADNGFGDRSSEAILEHAHRTVAEAIAGQRAFGIADTLIAQLLPTQAATARPGNADTSNAS